MWYPDNTSDRTFQQACWIAGLPTSIVPYRPNHVVKLQNGCIKYERYGTLKDDVSILPTHGIARELFKNNSDFKKVINWLNLNVFEKQLDYANERLNTQTLAVRLRIGSNMLIKLNSVSKTELLEIDNYIKNVFYLRQAVAFDLYCKEYLPF